MSPEIRLERNRHGRLSVQLADGTRHDTVTPVRAFPLEAPLEAISLVGPDGKEVCWIEHLDHLPADQRALLEDSPATTTELPLLDDIGIGGLMELAELLRWAGAAREVVDASGGGRPIPRR